MSGRCYGSHKPWCHLSLLRTSPMWLKFTIKTTLMLHRHFNATNYASFLSRPFSDKFDISFCFIDHVCCTGQHWRTKVWYIKICMPFSVVITSFLQQYHMIPRLPISQGFTCRLQWGFRYVHSTLGRDLMRERTRSRIQDGGRQMRSANTVSFLPFQHWFSTSNWCPRKFAFSVNTCDIQFDRICLLLVLGSEWNLTQDARTNFHRCANVHCIKTTDARTYNKMR